MIKCFTGEASDEKRQKVEESSEKVSLDNL